MIHRAAQHGAGPHDDFFIQNDTFQICTFADHAALHDDAVAHLRIGLQPHAAEENGIARSAFQRAAVGDDAVVDLGMLAVVGRNLIANLGVDRQTFF